jgi:hypothetical protein
MAAVVWAGDIIVVLHCRSEVDPGVVHKLSPSNLEALRLSG